MESFEDGIEEFVENTRSAGLPVNGHRVWT